MAVAFKVIVPQVASCLALFCFVAGQKDLLWNVLLETEILLFISYSSCCVKCVQMVTIPTLCGFIGADLGCFLTMFLLRLCLLVIIHVSQ